MKRYREPLDLYDFYPKEMKAYLRHNGWHFNKKLCDFATSLMSRRNKESGKIEPIKPWSKEQIEKVMKENEVELENNVGYDFVYVGNMVLADFFHSSILEEANVAQYIKDVVDDVDQADGFIMNRFYADSVRSGIPIPWEELL